MSVDRFAKQTTIEGAIAACNAAARLAVVNAQTLQELLDQFGPLSDSVEQAILDSVSTTEAAAAYVDLPAFGRIVNVIDIGAGKRINKISSSHAPTKQADDVWNGYHVNCWVASNQHIMFTKRKLGADPADVTIIDSGVVMADTTDNHFQPFFFFDANGHAVLLYGMHNNTPKWRLSTNAAGDVSAFGAENTTWFVGAAANSTTSYGWWVKRSDGKVLMMIRNGGAGNGDTLAYVWDHTTQTWGAAFTGALLIDGTASATSAYLYNVLRDDATGVIKLAYAFRVGDDTTNRRLCYIESADDGVTWRDITGAAITLPLVLGTTAVIVDDVASGSNFTGANSVACLDTTGRILIGYVKNDGNSIAQTYLAYWSGSAWVIEQVTNHAIQLAYNYSQTNELPARNVFCAPDGSIVIIGKQRQDTILSGVCAWVKPSGGSKWVQHLLIQDDAVQGNENQYPNAAKEGLLILRHCLAGFTDGSTGTYTVAPVFEMQVNYLGLIRLSRRGAKCEPARILTPMHAFSVACASVTVAGGVLSQAAYAYGLHLGTLYTPRWAILSLRGAKTSGDGVVRVRVVHRLDSGDTILASMDFSGAAEYRAYGLIDLSSVISQTGVILVEVLTTGTTTVGWVLGSLQLFVGS